MRICHRLNGVKSQSNLRAVLRFRRNTHRRRKNKIGSPPANPVKELSPGLTSPDRRVTVEGQEVKTGGVCGAGVVKRFAGRATSAPLVASPHSIRWVLTTEPQIAGSRYGDIREWRGLICSFVTQRIA
jgi:hypothetical protein